MRPADDAGIAPVINTRALRSLAKPWTPSRELVRTSSALGLGQLPISVDADAVVRSVCGFCSTGCSLDIHLKDGNAVNITPSPDYPVNSGSACPKGWEALAPLDATDRAVQPLLRSPNGEGMLPVSWDRALHEFVGRTRAVQAAHGPEAMAFLSTGQIPTEEMALLGALTKFGMGIRHGDGNTRQCMATAVVAYKQAFGFDAPPYTYADFALSDVIVLVGSNLAIAHPIMWERVAANPHDPTIIVVDPRRTETAAAATQHLALAPDSDLDLFYGLANLLIERGAVDRAFVEAHTTGFDDFAAHVAGYPVDAVADRTGLAPSALLAVADAIAGGRNVSFWWTMGVNQSHQGVRTAQSLINLALLTGNIGRPGTGANSITGQCNAMGSRLFSNTTGLLGGHDFAVPEHRRRVADVLDIDEGRIPREASWSYDRIMTGIDEGAIKGLWVIATNTAHSWIDQHGCHDLLDKLDFLVVQDMYHSTETAQVADLVLPAAGWGEKDGTFINSERRVGHITKVRSAPGEALADFWIFKAIAEAWGCADLFEAWQTPEHAFELLQELSAGRPCDITGIRGYEMLDATGGVQWPFPADDGIGPDDGTVAAAGGRGPETERRLFADGRFHTPDGRARFLFDPPTPVAEGVDDDFPLVLLTGRGSAADWHTRTRTEKSTVLAAMTAKAPYAEVHPDDVARYGLGGGRPAELRSRRGSVTVDVVETSAVQPGQVFVNMHFAETNRLTFPAFDPHSRQPAYKHCAVRLQPVAGSVPR
ncbi:MAG: nitrate reductase [Actinomycetota bacterium]